MITAWSHSRLQTFESCPHKARRLYVDKVRSEQNVYMKRGSDIHLHIERYLKYLDLELHGDIKKNRDFIRLVRSMPNLEVEPDWSFRNDWTQTSFDDWDGCWLRMKVDACYSLDKGVLTVLDWKTGRNNAVYSDGYLAQLELYCLSGLILKPHMDRAVSYLVYVDEGAIEPPKGVRVERKDVEMLKEKWTQKANKLLNADSFPKVPGSQCRYCQFNAECLDDIPR